MKKIIKLVTIAMMAAVGLILCSMQGCEKKPINQMDITDITHTFTTCELTDLPDPIMLINSTEELKKVCNNAPDIDFANSSLIIAKGGTPNEIESISCSLSKEKASAYILYVDIRMFDTTKPDYWEKCFITSKKIADNTTVKLNVNKHH